MKIQLTEEELLKLRAEVEGEEGDAVLDAYEPEPAFTMEFEYIKGGIDVLAAAYLAYDKPMDGWYLSDRIEDAALMAELIRAYLLAC
jgi:hypothetical protein